ncbi:N-6 DNA methylase [Marivita sp. GX14005]|uniref:N-6 DNA methylase n=1 Tax=Marivita sp. GX14005 TaxID=2942276 RepID=UPI002019AAF8|nr:N-6 DNA methylase [Marivita sp. GX14005]MCL3881027.1 N-6 DNA methylase [Marivita sp. GX14005]
MKLLDSLSQFRSTMRSDESFALFVKVAAAVARGETPQNPIARTISDIDLDTLIATSQRLLSEAPSERFAAIMDYVDALILGASNHGPDVWIRKGACLQLTKLIGDAPQVRFSFGMSLRPCMTFLASKRDQGTTATAEFCSPNTDECDFASDLAAIADLESHLTIVQAMPWDDHTTRKDAIEVILPPFGLDVSKYETLPQSLLSFLDLDERQSVRLNCETASISNALQRTLNRVIISTSDGELFRMVGTEKVARRNLIDSGRLKAVMAVPSGMMFANTGIKTNLVVIDPADKKADTVRLVDLGHATVTQKGRRGRLEVADDADWRALLDSQGSEDPTLVRDVDLDKVMANNTVLVPVRYLNSGARDRIDALLAKSDVAALEDIVELIRPVTISEDEEGEYTLFEAAPGDVNKRGFIAEPRREISVSRPKYNKAFNQQLRPGDVLLSIKGNVGITALAPDDVPKEGESVIWTSGQSMMILRPKQRIHVSSLALFEYLSNATVREHLQSIAGGTAIQTLAMKDIKSLPIPVPDDKTLADVEAGFAERQKLFDQIDALEHAVAKTRNQSWPHKVLFEGG